MQPIICSKSGRNKMTNILQLKFIKFYVLHIFTVDCQHSVRANWSPLNMPSLMSIFPSTIPKTLEKPCHPKCYKSPKTRCQIWSVITLKKNKQQQQRTIIRLACFNWIGKSTDCVYLVYSSTVWGFFFGIGKSIHAWYELNKCIASFCLMKIEKWASHSVVPTFHFDISCRTKWAKLHELSKPQQCFCLHGTSTRPHEWHESVTHKFKTYGWKKYEY